MLRTPHRSKGDDDTVRDEISAKAFGDLITADHIVLGSESNFSRHGDTVALVCQDCSTKWIGGYPAPAKGVDATVVALQHVAGRSRVKQMYTGGSGELEAASTELGFPYGDATPQPH